MLMPIRCGVLLALVCAMGLLPSIATAQPVLTEHVPADTVLYFSWRGTDEAGEQYTNSRLKAFLDESKLQDRFGKVMAEVIELGGNDREMQMFAGFIEHALPAAIQRPWTFYLAGFALEEDTDRPVPRIGFLIDPGDGPEGEAVVDWLVETFGDLEDEDVQLLEHGDLLGVIMGNAFVDPDAPDAPGSLKADADFAATLRGLGETPMFVGYADAKSGLQVVTDLAQLEGDADQAEKIKQVFESLGLMDVNHAAVTGSFEGRDWVQRLFVDAPVPRKGVLSLLEGEPIADADLAKISAQANWFRTVSLDPADALKLIRDTIDATGDDDALIDFEMGLKEAKDALGFDLEHDLINPAGDRWAIYSEPALGTIAGFYPGVALIHELDDAATVDAALLKFKDWANAQMEDERAPFKFVTMEFGDIKIHSLAFPMASPSWAVNDGRLYAAASASAITTADLHAGGEGPGLAGNADYQAMRKRLAALAGGEVKPIGLMYADLPKSSMTMYQSYAAVLNLWSGMMRGFGGEAGPNLAELLPPFNAMQPHLTPAGEMMWADAKGLHVVSIQPFPGAILLSPDAVLSTGIGAPALVPFTFFGTITPAMGAARANARQVASLSNVRQLTIGIHTYSADSNNQTPEDLIVLMEKGYLPGRPRAFLSSESGIEAPADFDEKTEQQKRDWLSLNASYILIPDLGTIDKLDHDSLMIIQKPAHASGGQLAVGFGDGHAESWTVKKTQVKVKEQTSKTLEELVKAAEARAPEGTPDVLAEATQRRAEIIAEIRARRAAEAAGE